MKKFFLPAFIMLLTATTFAGTVSLSDAQNVASNFYKVTANPQTTVIATLKFTKTESDNSVDFYVFDISPVKGFVIVAADDNISPILAYSTESNFNTNFKHSGVNHWISETAKNIHLALQHGAIAGTRISTQWSAYRQGINPNVQRSGSVGPLCSTTWDQESSYTNSAPYLYNLFCPYYAPDSQRALTGCVATAMAQVMKFWNYPTTGTGSYSYVDDTLNGYSNNYGPLSSDFAAHTYQWAQMPTILDSSSTPAQDTAVGQLMYDCGVSVGMDYGDDNQDGSGANSLLSEELQYVGDSISSQYALPLYFGYDPDTIQGIYRSDYPDSVWISMIEYQLNVGRPVIYEGDDTVDINGGGHAWVCDGYDVNNNLHMNWGWSGDGNGYFAVSNLYTTASGGPFNPIQDEDALIGILPKVNATGIKTVKNDILFKMYPNPAANDVALQSTDGGAYAIINLMGQSLMEGTITSAQTHINTSSLVPGVYFVELRSGENTAAKKLVISR
jgi:hypothetical protein